VLQAIIPRSIVTGADGSFLTEYFKKLTLIRSWQAALLGS
jgi:hypothetical protein